MHPSRVLDIQKFIDAQRLSPCQWLIFFLGFLVMVVDGYDTVAMGFIAPSLVREWGIGRSALGPVMSAALVGVAIGALMTGPVADRFGHIDAVFSLLIVPSLIAAGALCAIKPNRADRTVGAEMNQETAQQR